MPDPFERHGKSDGWGPSPSRSQLRRMAASDEVKRPAARKDPALCKAAHWKGPHQPELRVKQYGWSAKRECRYAISWRTDDEVGWHCCHEEFCSGCGKILRGKISDGECPGWHPVTDAERAALEAERAEHEARVAAARARSRWRPKPPVDGPQSYRRKRGA